MKKKISETRGRKTIGTAKKVSVGFSIDPLLLKKFKSKAKKEHLNKNEFYAAQILKYLSK